MAAEPRILIFQVTARTLDAHGLVGPSLHDVRHADLERKVQQRLEGLLADPGPRVADIDLVFRRPNPVMSSRIRTGSSRLWRFFGRCGARHPAFGPGSARHIQRPAQRPYHRLRQRGQGPRDARRDPSHTAGTKPFRPPGTRPKGCFAGCCPGCCPGRCLVVAQHAAHQSLDVDLDVDRARDEFGRRLCPDAGRRADWTRPTASQAPGVRFPFSSHVLRGRRPRAGSRRFRSFSTGKGWRRQVRSISVSPEEIPTNRLRFQCPPAPIAPTPTARSGTRSGTRRALPYRRRAGRRPFP